VQKIFIIIILLFITIEGNAQGTKKEHRLKKDNFKIQIDSINYFLQRYDTLSPFSDHENIYDIISLTRQEITTRLLNVLNDKKILEYQIENLFTSSELTISKSDDNKIYFLSIDEKTGGSYRTSITIIHYRLRNGVFKSEYYGGDPEGSSSSTYGQPYLIDSMNQKYFIIGSVQTCNTCNLSSAMTLKIDSNSYKVNTVFQFEGRYYDLEIFDYNEVDKVFSYEYSSSEQDDSLYGDGDIPLGFRRKYRGKFKYYNGEFLQIENCEFLDKKE
jgi:hypothetical protein